MIPESFNYHCPATIEEAIALASDHGDEAKYMSGGHSLIPMMKLRFATPAHVIDISRLEGLSYIKEEDGLLKIGGLTTEADLEYSELLAKKYPILIDVAKLIADPSVRNKATLGGNLAHGDSANDQPAVMLALRATIVATGPEGTGQASIDDFFHGFYMTALGPQDILTEIQIPVAGKGTGSAYHKIERKAGDYAASGVAVNLQIDGSGTCKEIGIGLTNVNPVPLRAQRSEDHLKGKKLTGDLILEAAKMAAEDCSPSADLRGSEAYKRSITRELTVRMINKALERAKANL
ncbi:MAG: xanthine dehydrogenase family protein subunit M [Cyclobacteriaceae bacterium]|nr:xanthine dehydrogenase family protein subunit M [Cyclobacteriaceae bacterium]